ncbi:MAG TPA: DUF559 domain-containing protein [Candidatus Dormibacteraeota bacterium]|nr:DUF559 domain-containing protein [Candidatus Dormibacteraeota bacterium]
MSAVPNELRTDPFLVSDAKDVGLTWENLQAQSWRRLAHGQYAWTGIPNDVDLKLRAAEKRLPPTSAFCGRTAGWILGLDMPPCDPIEAMIPRDSRERRRAGIRLRRAELPPEDVVMKAGYRVTSPLRTVRDLGSRRDLIEAVVVIDMALHAGLVDVAALTGWVEGNAGAKGVKRLRRALALANPNAESPMETRLRLELIAARLPVPQAQVELRHRDGDFLARVDLYYPDAGLVIEYDGENHKDRLVEDLRRQNALINAGYHVLRFTAADLRFRGVVASQVRRARSLLLRRAA